MKKIFTLRRWQTLSQAARYLSTVFNEDVSEADILHFSLDFGPNRIKLSAIFTGDCPAYFCKRIDDEDSVKYQEVPCLSGNGTIKLPIDGEIIFHSSGHMMQVQERVIRLEENYPYELAMFGGERADIECRYWELMGSNVEETINLHGTFVSDGEKTFQLLNSLPSQKGERTSYYPVGRLPEDCALVVRTDALIGFVESMATSDVKPLVTTERNTLLVMIAALCKRAEIDPLGSKAAGELVRLVDLLGNGASVSDDTARKVLRQVPDALGARGK